MKRALGIFIIFSIFAGIYGIAIVDLGMQAATLTFLGAAGLVALIVFAVWLISD